MGVDAAIGEVTEGGVVGAQPLPVAERRPRHPERRTATIAARRVWMTGFSLALTMSQPEVAVRATPLASAIPLGGRRRRVAG